ncbi:acyl-CoA dehydrogenase family protein [Microbacterium betulae]|uniref:Dibenzothiophene monooxygenase n=1 Tax=Microbacterium betulae TaxID=2981139 RepID=A0AA97I7C2_9MICO|nr:acyl-CoA dehydrogenase family protein [Microbacterium sp. AB]
MEHAAKARDQDEHERLATRFRPLFQRIAEGEAERERTGTVPHEQLGWLVDAGFAGFRIPGDLGGEDARLSTAFRLVAELAEADVNLAHIWRNHLSFVEDRRYDRADPRTDEWLRRLGSGEIVGGGWSEPDTDVGSVRTTLLPDAEGVLRLNGTKYYATGSVYARWTTVLAADEAGHRVVALVDMTSDGVAVGDDWDGFGQRLTGSGSVAYVDVAVPAERVFSYAKRYVYQSQFYQSALNALLVGIGNAILRDGIAALRARRRSHGNALVPEPVDDPELQEVIGRLAANAFAAEATLLRSLDLVDVAVARAEAGDTAQDRASLLAVGAAQHAISTLVLESATLVFDSLGSSGVSERHALDRHWRNARTIASHNPRVYRTRLVGGWALEDAARGDTEDA